MIAALALWLIVVPGTDWTFVISAGPYESKAVCEYELGKRVDRRQALCVKVEMPS